jgi:transposase InsO family protein
MNMETNSSQSAIHNSQLEIPLVPNSKISDDIIKRVAALERLVVGTLHATSAKEAFVLASQESGIAIPTLHWYCARLRQLFNLPKRTPLSTIANHPQLHQALEFLLTRKERGDRLSLLSGKGLSVIVPSNGELLGIEDFLKSLYPREGVNATSCYRVLKARCLKKQVIVDERVSPVGTLHATSGQQNPSEGSTRPATLEDLPAERTVIRFLQQWRDEYVAVRRGRSRKNDFEKFQQPYVTRDVTKFRPGELWIADHTELDFMVLNENGQLDRRWISAFIDIRTGLLVGYHLSWQPNSETIALAFRNGILGSQLKAFSESKYVPVQMMNVPETVMMDNGKDYRSNYTKRVFGKIDFDDDARVSIQRMTRLHYTLPYHGQSKAQMERWFRTIQIMLKYLPGFKGNQYQNKPDSLKEDIKQQNILTVEQFDAAVAVAINSYNNREHRSLKGQSPLACYLTNQTQQRGIDLRVLDFLLLKAKDRRIKRCQVTLFGKEYYSESLLTHNDKMANVYFDPNDLGFVSIYVDAQFAAVASNKEMIGQDERGWQKILRDRKHGEKEMRQQLTGFRNNISDADARVMLLEGELLNNQSISKELFQKRTTSVTLLTGLEETASEQQQEMEHAKNVADIEKRSRKRGTSTGLSIAAVNDRIR